MKKKLGFSFLEISVVIAVVGLVMFGIFQGGELINKSKISSARQTTKASLIGKMDGLTLWLDTTMPNSFSSTNLANGDVITNWYDLTLNNNDFSGTATYLADGINGLPVLKFNGSQNFVKSSVVINDLVQANQGTVFIVQNYTSSGSNTSSIFWNETSSQNYRLHIRALGNDGILYFEFGVCCTSTGRTTYTPSNFASKANIITLLKNTSSSSININGTTVTSNVSATGSFATSTASNFNIGTDGSAGFIGNIAEVIIFERALSDNEIKDVEKYLSKKWGIAISL